LTIAPLTARWAEPATVSALATFACGGSTPYEIEVDDLVHQLHAQSPYPIRVVEDSAGDLAGLCCFYRNALGSFADAAYVALIAVAASFRRQRVGDILLGDALSCISAAVGGPMPLVWAMIAPDNQSSHRLFERHGFHDVLRRQSTTTPRTTGASVLRGYPCE
jgi:ribosomal protein S18 acetylase RimI-like enzyme